MKKKMLATALVATMVLSMTACGGKEDVEYGKTSENGQQMWESDDNKISGGAKLTLTSDEEIKIWDDYFVYVDKDNGGVKDIVDADGQVQIVDYLYTGVLGDNYFVKNSYYDEKQKGYYSLVLKDGEEVFRVNQDSFGGYDYQNGIFYYTNLIKENDFVIKREAVAYDLVAQKELWRTEGEDPSLQGDFIILKNKYAISVGDDELYSKIVDLNGNTIVEATEEYNIYPTAVHYYIKSKLNEYVEVYDFEHNKISELSLVSDDSNIVLTLENVLDNGMYTISEMNSETDDFMTQLYDVNSNLLKENAFISNYGQHEEIMECFMGENDCFLILSEMGIVAEVEDILWVASDVDKIYFAMVEKQNGDNVETCIYNLVNGKYMVCDSKMEDYFEQALDGSYFIIKNEDSNKYLVYNSDFEIIYEGTDNSLHSVDAEYVLEAGDEIALIHLESGEKTQLKVEGNYRENNRYGMVTYDGDKHYLYKIN